jgi:hypothetical protein
MKTEVIHIRVDKELRDKLQNMADSDKRTLGDFIRVQLERLLESSKRKK